ncbi:hypothetical protein J6590_010031 [Homalodisca vitripennis]|nr:hypothetical protein J6590_010031 [Homalodisca vitripennis]
MPRVTNAGHPANLARARAHGRGLYERQGAGAGVRAVPACLQHVVACQNVSTAAPLTCLSGHRQSTKLCCLMAAIRHLTSQRILQSSISTWSNQKLCLAFIRAHTYRYIHKQDNDSKNETLLVIKEQAIPTSDRMELISSMTLTMTI